MLAEGAPTRKQYDDALANSRKQRNGPDINRANETKPGAERSYRGDDAFDTVAEKVSGALKFLPRLEGLKSITDKAYHFITEIITYNKELYPKVLVEIEILEEALKQEKARKIELYDELENALKSNVAVYNQFKSVEAKYRSGLEIDQYKIGFSDENWVEIYSQFLRDTSIPRFHRFLDANRELSSKLGSVLSRKTRLEEYSASMNDFFEREFRNIFQ